MMIFPSRFRSCFVCINLLAVLFGSGALIAKAQQPPVAVINAASYTEFVAPDSIAALFGTKLATRTEVANTIPLPTSLAGTTVTVGGQAAMLFFVDPNQVNFLIPAGAQVGRVEVVVTSGDGAVSRGQMQVQNTATGVFTQNASGVGVPAAQLIRVRNGVQTFELPYQLVNGRFITKPIDLGPPGDEVYLVLYVTGLRRVSDPVQSVKLAGAGQTLPVLFAGAQGGFAGLDQINLLLPRTLANRGLVSFTVTIPNAVASNPFDLEFRQTDATPLAIEAFTPVPAVVGQALSIAGRGFSPNKARNQVRILGTAQYEALVTDATATSMTVLLPLGTESGTVSVSNLDGAGGYANSAQNLTIRTSLSGAFKDTAGNKIKNMQVKVVDALGKSFSDMTNDEGVFVIPGLAPGTATIELSGGLSPAQLPYPQVMFKKRISADRDNPLDFPSTLQAINGTPSSLNADGTVQHRSLRLSVPLAKTNTAAPDREIRNGEVVLDLPDNAVIAFPDGRPVNQIALSLVGRSLTPVALPLRHFSQTIVMISPLGATITPGAKLTFPNGDGFPANAQVELFRFNQQPNTDEFGEFVLAGRATVSADGRTIVTPVNAIKETTYYFASALRPTVTVTGTVVETGQLPLPVKDVLMGSRGRSTMTDPNGNFSVSNVPFNAGSLPFADGAVIDLSSGTVPAQVADLISLEANYLRPTRIVSRREKDGIAPTGDGNTTSAGTIELGPPPASNPPVIQLPSLITVKAGQVSEFEFSVQVSPGQSVNVSASGVNFATVAAQGAGFYKLTLSPALTEAGSYTLVITAVSNLGQPATKQIPLTVTP